MPRLPASSLARTLGKSSSRAPLTGTVLRAMGGTASVTAPVSTGLVRTRMASGRAVSTVPSTALSTMGCQAAGSLVTTISGRPVAVARSAT